VSDRVNTSEDLQEPPSRTEDRYEIDERTGIACVKARPGARKVTSEEIRELLEDFQ
jgi:hypothetical protein